ncbi:glycolate and propanediol utilization protein [Candidatus Kinetoplastibacterium desouzaii TCC079E]|uniref:Glycolate and propanediol utilization protein n=1 Tax=Candidatus Kinetoplastidibacterium desouzai TCC079E TaxID=1208919 RepID=M1LMP4_9PROT|nr:heme-binding protein [Candidatus Kinetoplastibacterium desouzaii]AGF46997.1 glycolate and propanediol utilization protein [Candidatus Kinetoplastibacterium desouzaii TCC079E]
MNTKPVLNITDIKKILNASEEYAIQKSLKVTIAIVDDGGHLLSLLRMDGAPPISAYIAPAKAKTSAIGKRESKIYEDIINSGFYAFLSAPFLEGMLAGGLPIIFEGQVIGAVGVSGAKSEEDVEVARSGILALI